MGRDLVRIKFPDESYATFFYEGRRGTDLSDKITKRYGEGVFTQSVSPCPPGTDMVECRVCGNFDTLNWVESTRKLLKEHQVCFSCAFWRGRTIAMYRSRNRHKLAAVMSDQKRIGIYFVDKPKYTNTRWNGFGGAKFRIRFFDDDTIVESNNVWFNGYVPPIWQPCLQPNAEIIREVGI